MCFGVGCNVGLVYAVRCAVMWALLWAQLYGLRCRVCVCSYVGSVVGISIYGMF